MNLLFWVRFVSEFGIWNQVAYLNRAFAGLRAGDFRTEYEQRTCQTTDTA
jgi:hypothetical protein